MNFKELLEKNSPIQIEGYDGLIPAVFIKDLGEWAWDELKKHSSVMNTRIYEYNSNKQYWKENNIFPDKSLLQFIDQELRNNKWGLFFEITIACLGKAEVEKRLKELSQNAKR